MDNHVHQHGITPLIYRVRIRDRISPFCMLTATMNHHISLHMHMPYWVYWYIHAQSDLLSDLEPLDRPVNASISLTQSATLELTSVKPDDGATVAIAGEKGAVAWCGQLNHLCMHIP